MMSSAPRYNPIYSTEDYLRWEGDWELLEGVAVSMSPSPFGPHQALASQLITALVVATQANEKCKSCVVFTELDWIVNKTTVVRPDIILSCGETPKQHLEKTPNLIVEILSPSTEEKDRTIKFDLYREQGVRHYLLADPANRSLVVNTLVGGEYELQAVHTPLELRINADCKIQLDLSKIALLDVPKQVDG